MRFSYRDARLIGMTRLEVDLAFARVVAAIDRNYPDEFKVQPIVMYVDQDERCVGQMGSQEQNLDMASKFVIGKMLGAERDTPAYERLTRWNDEISSLRSFLMMPDFVRGTYASLADYQRKRGVVHEPGYTATGFLGRVAQAFRKPRTDRLIAG